MIGKPLVIGLVVWLMVNACYKHSLTVPPAFDPFCGGPAPNFKFILLDKDSTSLLTPEKLPRFYSLENNVLKYVDYQWKIRPFMTDSTQHYMEATTIGGSENKTVTFYFLDSSGLSNRVDAVIGNATDRDCPFVYTYKQVRFNNKVVPITFSAKDQLPYYAFRLN